MILKANGLDFACDVAGDGDDVALCLHGFPESRFSWRYQLPFLAAQGWRAVAPDLPGDPRHLVTEPSEAEINAALRAHGLPGEAADWRDALDAAAGMRL